MVVVSNRTIHFSFASGTDWYLFLLVSILLQSYSYKVYDITYNDLINER